MGRIITYFIKPIKDALRLSNNPPTTYQWTVETKFALGADVWLMWENKPIRAHIDEISLHFIEDDWKKKLFENLKERYFINLLHDEGHYHGEWVSPDILYASKEDLLKSL